MREIYLDNAATTRVRPEVAELMSRIMEEDYANPSSMHIFGVRAERYVREAQETLAGILRVSPDEIVMTSGGTEGAGSAIIGTALKKRRLGRHIIASAIEHPAVSETLKFLKGEGFEVTLIPVDAAGRVDMDFLRGSVRPDTILVSIMSVNNEIGVIEDLGAVSRIVKSVNPDTYIHTDAVQAFGKLMVRPRETGVDLLSVSAHKIHGPKGAGFMYVSAASPIEPVIRGGGQQRGMRSGTLDVPSIAGMAMAARMYMDEQSEIVSRMEALRSRLTGRFLAMDDVDVIGAGQEGFAPHILSASFHGVRAEVLLHALEERGVYVSAGSACSSHKRRPSDTLSAIGLKKEAIEGTLRFSFGIYNETADVDRAADIIAELLPPLRRYRRH